MPQAVRAVLPNAAGSTGYSTEGSSPCVCDGNSDGLLALAVVGTVQLVAWIRCRHNPYKDR